MHILRCTLLILSAAALALAAGDNPQVTSAKSFWNEAEKVVLKSADKMPEDKFGYKPTDSVRSYGAILAHIADGNYEICGVAREGKPKDSSFEKTAKSKAEILKALKESFAYCDAGFAGLTDAGGAKMVPWFGQGERTKLSVLSYNTTHVYEHYGNLVTYLRMNGLVPPSSEGQQ